MNWTGNRIRAIAVTFLASSSVAALTVPRQAAPVAATATPPPDEAAAPVATEAIFKGGADSLVARAVGSAEGTRTADGAKTPAFYGHKDPGNGVWNLGSFSFQHGAKTPEQADEKQLLTLQQQAAELQQKAADKGIALDLPETLNAIDLANQAPQAALDRGGFIDWLADAKNRGMAGEDAIVWARTRSFLDPDSQRWNAPGLGNNVHSISKDQERRMQAIARTIKQAARPGTP